MLRNGIYKLFFAGLVGLTAGSCMFYSLKGSLPAHIRTISISPVINETGEFGVGESVSEQISNILIQENVLDVVNEDIADSRLNVTIKSVRDEPYTFTAAQENEYERVEEWRITVKATVLWYDLTRDEPLFEVTKSAWGAYGLGVDISSDKIDNDGDGLLDADDDDEFGSPRESALLLAITKLSEDIISEVTSTW